MPRGLGTPGLHVTEAPCPPSPICLVSPSFDFLVRVLAFTAECFSPFWRDWGARFGRLRESFPRLYLLFFLRAHPTKPKTMVHCAGCKRPILDRFLLNVLDRAWHVKCVQCCECKCNLTEKCFSREGKLYCKNDFFR